MWGVYPEAMAWNVGAVHSDFNLGERILRSSPKRANLKAYCEICPFRATSPDTLCYTLLLLSHLFQSHVGQASTSPILDSAILCVLSGIVAWYKRPVLAGSLKER